MNEISTWSDSVFGECQRNPAIVYHLKKEVDELIECFESGVVTQKEQDKLLMEFADCMMLLVDSASHAFFTANDLVSAMKKKLEINKERKWGNPDENGVIRHIGSNKSQPEETLRKELKKFNTWMCGEQYDGKIPLIDTCIDDYLKSKE